MLAESKLPTTFWAEVVNTACYVQNRALVVKPHNKTPYELFRGRTPALSFMRPFGYHVTILNTLDHLDKFDGKANEGTNSNDFAGTKDSIGADKESGALNELNYAFENLNTEYPDDPKMYGLEIIATYDDSKEDADFINLESLIHVEAIREELLQFKLQKGWILVDLPKGKKAIGTKWVFRTKKDERGIVIKNKASQVSIGQWVSQRKDRSDLIYQEKKGDILLVHIYVDDIIFGSTKKGLCTEFERLMKDKFQMSSIEELTFFLGFQVKQKEDGIFISQDKYVTEVLRKFNFSDVKSASNPVDTKKTLVKNADGDDVDVHLYRSMIGSLMYLIASRLDIIDSPFELVAYTDSDYAGASLDRKSTTGGCPFLGSRLISWQCKKQTVNSSYPGVRKKYRISLKNDMPPRDK
nr:putative ribonuclease H-like domain-containing protein [Tanacetum cinerariifolium]